MTDLEVGLRMSFGKWRLVSDSTKAMATSREGNRISQSEMMAEQILIDSVHISRDTLDSLK